MKYIVILAILLIVLLTFYLISNKVKVKFKTFFHRGFRPSRGNFGIYCYDGKQGKGKTYSLVEYLIDHKNSSMIFCNIADIKNLDYEYFTGFKELMEIKKYIDSPNFHTHKQIIIVFDEIFTELQKKSVLTQDVLDFLCQMRKRQIIFLTTAQEWAEIPLTFRRFCRYRINCNMFPFLGTGILIKTFYDAENMKWSNDEQEFVAPLCETTLSHTRKFIADSYNTFLRISSVNADKIS